MNKQWSKEKIWSWYNARPWIRGCNYMSADCANRIDQWQELGFEERFKTTEEELALMQETGFNSIRVILEFLVWDKEHDGFMERFERYLSLCAKYGISCMVTLANDCLRPKSLEVTKLGEQSFDIGYHGGRRLSQHGSLGMGYHEALDDPEKAPRYFEMVREIVERYKNDDRIVIWDAYNEVGAAGRRNVSMPNLQKIFDIIREIDPIQPVTSCVWDYNPDIPESLSEVGKYSLENSDIISYHCYGGYEKHIKLIANLREYGRPIVCTEWLARCFNDNVQELFPLFFLEKVGCYNWGFVAGKYQTFEPWNSVWENYEKNPNFKCDFTKWFHDLYRPNHRPYDPHEIEIIKRFCALSDKYFAENLK